MVGSEMKHAPFFFLGNFVNETEKFRESNTSDASASIAVAGDKNEVQAPT